MATVSPLQTPVTTTEHPAATAYLICATPRSGSTLLCGLLASTEVAGRPESYFRAPDERLWADRWSVSRRVDDSVDYPQFVRAARIAGSTPNGVFAARIMWGTLDELVGHLRRAGSTGTDLDVVTRAFGPVRFVFLRRRDPIAQAVSWAKAEQTQYWHPGNVAVAEPRYDFEEIRHWHALVEQHNAAWQDWFRRHGVHPYELWYEELAADPVGTVRNLLSDLGLPLPPDGKIVARDRRQADQTNADWIARYRAGVA